MEIRDIFIVRFVIHIFEWNLFDLVDTKMTCTKLDDLLLPLPPERPTSLSTTFLRISWEIGRSKIKFLTSWKQLLSMAADFSVHIVPEKTGDQRSKTNL